MTFFGKLMRVLVFVGILTPFLIALVGFTAPVFFPAGTYEPAELSAN